MIIIIPKQLIPSVNGEPVVNNVKKILNSDIIYKASLIAVQDGNKYYIYKSNYDHLPIVTETELRQLIEKALNKNKLF